MAEEGDVQNSVKETPVAGKKAKIFQRIRPLIPPSGFLGRFLTRGVIVLLSWAVLWSIVGRDVLPGGNIFGIFIVIVLAALGGFLTRRLSKDALPSLLGMLIVGFILRNVPGVDVARYIDKTWSANLRSMALVVILTRSGLELDPGALKRLKFAVIRLAFCPCIGEAIAVAVVGKLLLDMPWLWGFQLGFVLGAVTPAVVVPQLLTLQAKGFGVKQGIPTLVMAASSFDDVIAISLFGVFLGIAFSKGNLVFNIFRGPIELLMGVVFGSLVGLLCWFLPNKMEVLSKTTSGMFFFHSKPELHSAGRTSLWFYFSSLMIFIVAVFSGKAFGLLTIVMVIRMIITFLVVSGNSLSVREKIFVAIAWSPKATVQAAIGSLSLDIARERGFAGMRQEELGIQILTIAVLSILFTAPSGAVAIAVSGPRLLQKVETRQQETGDNVEAEPIFDDHHSEGLEFNAIT
ncbi:PREDICTED: mitochondrial sodium/hydrogen exchanger 9B2-like [Acropora digitifera]|uniref:mitochondrial sodium/hydrogen exchanger 9B2-like n=1 Tax=Acropora digitifera TaxID=70779 RepID=UPI00077A757B|nr:PREDICTED: mitochondrial sodium/hydrogen exchanger 9B2-like [Acropora digitifera]